MFDRVKRCSISDGVMIRLNNFLIVFNLRQGTILVAVHQIALSSFMLIIMLVGMSHAGEMMMMLHNDMEDDAERRGFYDVTFGDQLLFHEGDVVSTNNQRRFAKAQSLASMTVILLYTATIFTAVYLFCCILLLHGAVRCARAYMLPWLCAATVAAVLLCALAVAGDSYPCVVELFGGHRVYHLVCALIVLSFIYAILAVGSYAFELGRLSRTDEGERLLLLHHASHCSLMSAAQLSKLSAQSTRSQFV